MLPKNIFSIWSSLKKQLFWDMYNKFLNPGPITLWGTGKESRDFIYIDDIVRIIELAIEHSDFKADAINVANGRQETIEYVADEFAKTLKSNKPVIFNNKMRKGDPLNWQADIRTIKSWEYRQSVTLKECIEKYIEWVTTEKR